MGSPRGRGSHKITVTIWNHIATDEIDLATSADEAYRE